MSETLEKVLRWVVLAGLFLLPFVCLFVTTSLFFPYITGKNFAFRIIVEVMTGAWLALMAVRSEYRPRKSWILAGLAIFVGIIALADITGENPFKSIWSNFERMDGLVTLVHVLLYTVVAASVVRAESLWRALFHTSLGVSTYVAIYGLLQVAGISALGQGGAAGLSARVDATFGNPIYLAVYLLFHIFIAAHLWFQSWRDADRTSRVGISLLYGGSMLLNTLVLFFTGTRGTMLGLIGGVFLTALIFAFTARHVRIVRRGALGAIIALLVLALGFMLVKDQAWVAKVGFLHRLATISLSDNTVKARIINWSIAWQGVKERPLLGWGQENYAIVFDKYYDPRMYAQEPWFDRVHNIVFDWLVAGGILGLIAYLGIFGAALYTLWRSREFHFAERAIFTGLLAAYFCHNFFVFDNVTSYILFGTVLAYIAWRASQHSEPLFSRFTLPRVALPFIAIAAIGLIWFASAWVNGDAIRANRTLLQALMAQSPETMLDAYKRAIAFGTIGTQEAREQLSQAAAGIAAADIPVEIKRQFFETASSEMLLQARAVPLDARFPLFLGILHDAYGDYENGAVALRQAHSLSLKKQGILFELGRNALLRGENTEALEYYRIAFELAPEYLDARISYATAAIRTGNLELGETLLEAVVASGEAVDPRIAAAYVAVSRYDRAIRIWEAHLAAKPSDTQAYFTLAALYYESGNRTKAIEALERAKRANPELTAQVDSLIADIKSGALDVQ